MPIQPAVVRVPVLVAFADVNHGPPPGSCKRTILVITTNVKRYMCRPPPAPRPSTNPLNLRTLRRPFGQFPAAPPLVYSDKESAATAPRPPTIFSMDSSLSSQTTRNTQDSPTP